jgi:hypothetical protein
MGLYADPDKITTPKILGMFRIWAVLLALILVLADGPLRQDILQVSAIKVIKGRYLRMMKR